MITITHTCGHTQACRFDELAARLVAQGKRTQEHADDFIARQQRWLECNLCPACYCAAKEADPNTKPVDPPTPENILQQAALGVLRTMVKERP